MLPLRLTSTRKPWWQRDDAAPKFAAPAGDRLAALEDAVAELRRDVAALRSEFASVRGQTEREDAAS